VNSVLHDQPPTFTSCEVTAPDGLEVALARSLAKNRDQRYGSVAEFVSALAPYASRHGALSVRMSRGIAGTLSSTPMLTDSQPILTVGGSDARMSGARGTRGDGGSDSASRQGSGSGDVSQVPAAPWTQRTTDRGRRSRQGILLGALVLLAGSGFLVYRFALQRESGGQAAGQGASPAPAAATSPIVPDESKKATAANTEQNPAVEDLPHAASGDSASAPQTGAIAAPIPAPAPGATATPTAATPAAGAHPNPNLALPHRPTPTPTPTTPRVQAAPAPAPVPARPVTPAPGSATGVSDFGGRR
jgi:serine/threonine-protein kinase